MTNRREFLQIGLAGAAIVPLAAFGRPAYAPAPSPLYKAIFDERFPVSIAFALELNRRGIPIHGIRGDITALWYHDLYFQWRSGPVAIAGMTTNESRLGQKSLWRSRVLVHPSDAARRGWNFREEWQDFWCRGPKPRSDG